MERELRELRRELDQVDRGRGVWYPDALRARIAAWGRRRRAEGATLRELEIEIGVCADTLRRWTAGKTARLSLVPVEVVAEPAMKMRDGLRVITAAGHTIEGLTIADAIAIARVLG